LAAVIAEVEPQRSGVIFKIGEFRFIEPLEQLLHLVEIVGVVVAGGAGATARLILNGRKHLDLHNMPQVRAGRDGPLAHVARVMKHRVLRFQALPSRSHPLFAAVIGGVVMML
jgi:hypothetical protein